MSQPIIRKCATMNMHRKLLETIPNYKQSRQAVEKHAQSWIALNIKREGIAKIPTCVHIVYNTPEQNISDEQVHSQIRILNEDFRKRNADSSSIPSAFQPLAADSRIEFHLAVRDPDGNGTNGITRTSTSRSFFDMEDNAVKFSTKGGKDAWPSDKYLNIWVCGEIHEQGQSDVLGYAQFPTDLITAPKTDGVVIWYKVFGNIGTATKPFDKGRTCTHEVGHWLDLLHIWGDDDPRFGDERFMCARDDNVLDTPIQARRNYGEQIGDSFVCPTFPKISCNNAPNGEMFINYMDYTYDHCMFMFTSGQCARMDAGLNGPRSSILSSNGLIPPSADPNDVLRSMTKKEKRESGALFWDGSEYVEL